MTLSIAVKASLSLPVILHLNLNERMSLSRDITIFDVISIVFFRTQFKFDGFLFGNLYELDYLKILVVAFENKFHILFYSFVQKDSWAWKVNHLLQNGSMCTMAIFHCVNETLVKQWTLKSRFHVLYWIIRVMMWLVRKAKYKSIRVEQTIVYLLGTFDEELLKVNESISKIGRFHLFKRRKWIKSEYELDDG